MMIQSYQIHLYFSFFNSGIIVENSVGF